MRVAAATPGRRNIELYRRKQLTNEEDSAMQTVLDTIDEPRRAARAEIMVQKYRNII